MEDNEVFGIKIDEEVTESKGKARKVKPEGVPWEELKFKLNARDFAQVMRDHELLTYQDVRTNAQLVVRLLQQQYRVDLGVVLAFAKEHEED